ncbi:MAG: 2-dehydro-3-deoxygalactonokinase [Bacteroidota bacterium]
MSTQRHDVLISCDWGTTNLRMFLVDTETHQIRASLASDDGAVKINAEFQKINNGNRVSFFREFLQKKLGKLLKKHGISSKGIPIFASGMVSSTIGAIEVPYASLPFSCKTPELNFEFFEATSNFSNPFYVFGGIKDKLDVIRGEETQLLGLQEEFPTGECILILPGTHSKHIFINKREVVHFKTFMTGEVFQLLSEKSLLKNSVQKSSILEHSRSFKKGILASQSKGLFHELFSIRAKSLLQLASLQENHAFLSGLVIGEELKTISRHQNQIVLASTEPLGSLYELALDTLDHKNSVKIVPPEIIDNAVPMAHLKLYQNLIAPK